MLLLLLGTLISVDNSQDATINEISLIKNLVNKQRLLLCIKCNLLLVKKTTVKTKKIIHKKHTSSTQVIYQYKKKKKFLPTNHQKNKDS